MALTLSVVKKNVVGNQREAIVDVTFDSSYPTGGEAFVPNDFDKSAASTDVFHFVGITQNDATVADHRLVTYDHTNKKLLVLVTLASGANVEATNASDQSAVKIRCLCRYGGATG